MFHQPTLPDWVTHYMPITSIEEKFEMTPVRPGLVIYLKWNKPQSTKPSGLYLCRVSEHLSEGLSEVGYRGDTYEHVDLSTTTWAYAKGNCYNKHYLPLVKSPPAYTPKVLDESQPCRLSNPHKAKEFADDLTILSEDVREHQETL